MDTHLHLKISTQCLAFVGFWPLNISNKLLSLLYSLYFKFTITTCVWFVATEFIELWMVFGKELEEFSAVLGIFLLHTLAILKAWVVGGKAVKMLAKKIQKTEQGIVKSDDETMKNIYLSHVRANHRANRIMITLAGLSSFLYGLAPFLAEILNSPTARYDKIDNDTIVYRPRPLPIGSWFPFDRYKYYTLAYAAHIIAITIVPSYIVACNNFFFGLTIFPVGQIKILQESLKKLTQTCKEQSEPSVGENLKKCSEYHKAIILFVKELSNAMKTFMMLDFLMCGLQIAVIGFQAAVADMSFKLLKTTTYLVTMLIQLFLFYWYANEILYESMNVSKSIWETEWYECNETIKKTLLTIMVRTQKPLTLSVGPFYNMSTQTMMTIIRAAYSYAAVMRQFYKKQ